MENEQVVSTPVMSETDKKIADLEARVAKLEQIEKKRRTMKIISIVAKVVLFFIMIGAMCALYLYMKSYFDELSGLSNLKNGLNLDGGSLDGLDINQYLNGLFNY